MYWHELIVTVLALKLIASIEGNHFRGGYGTWTWKEGLTVEFHTSLGWETGRGPGCTPSLIGTFLQASPSDNNFYWVCEKGCSGKPNMRYSDYTCMAANLNEGWEQGEDTWNYTFPNEGPFDISYKGSGWVQMANGKGGSDWNLKTTVDLRPRSDTGHPNSSPITMSNSLYYKQYECNHTMPIPVQDNDGDIVRCRWAKGHECESVCNALPSSTLDEENCILQFDGHHVAGYISGGNYAVAIVIEDFPRTSITMGGVNKTPKTPLSTVSVQFMIQTPTMPTPCDTKPRFIPGTPEQGEIIWAIAGDKVVIGVYADNYKDDSVAIQEITVRAPLHATIGSLQDDHTRTNTKYRTLEWHTSRDDKGKHIVCADATNVNRKSGDPRCFSIVVEIDYCAPKPCKHGGFCVNLANDFACICTPGYTAKDCGIDINECQTMPCLNGATCNDLIANFTCDCAPGFSGRICQLTYDFCTPNPCHNGGQCRNEPTDFFCDCVDGWTGRLCDYRYRFQEGRVRINGTMYDTFPTGN